MRRFDKKRTSRSWNLGAVTVLTIMVGAMSSSCVLGTKTNFCEKFGLRCDVGKECAVNQAVCIDIGGCGNGVIELSEVCDDGNIIDGDIDDNGVFVADGCNHDCTSNQECGNGILDRGEECDAGVFNGTPDIPCDFVCRIVCGNGIIDTDVGEQCDPGPMDSAGCNSNMAGLSSCKISRCGDGYTNTMAGEKCDSGGVDSAQCNGSSANPVAVRCQLPVCGDNHVNSAAGEECDPTTTGSDTAICNGKNAGSAKCKLAACGDGYFNAAAEQCENNTNCMMPQICNSMCQCI